MGNRLFKTVSTFRKNGKIAKNLPIAIGLARQSPSTKLFKDQEKGWIALWDKFSGTELATGILMDPKRISAIEDQSGSKKNVGHALIITNTDANGQVEFYAGYGWEKAGEINSANEWKNYLNLFKGEQR